jgi:hypothetical protein
MSYSAPLELLTDASGAVSFGWVDHGVYLASFMRCLSARLAEVFLGRVRDSLSQQAQLRCFADARWLQSYDLMARRALVQFVQERRESFQEIVVLSWAGVDMAGELPRSLGDGVVFTDAPADFEARLRRVSPLAEVKLGAWADAMPSPRWAPRH